MAHHPFKNYDQHFRFIQCVFVCWTDDRNVIKCVVNEERNFKYNINLSHNLDLKISGKNIRTFQLKSKNFIDFKWKLK